MPQSAYLITTVVSSRTLIGLLLLASGVAKMAYRTSFQAALRGFALLPEELLSSVAIALPALECLAGGCLVLAIVLQDSFTRWAAVSAMALFATFAVAIAINLIRGRRDIPCGCFGSRDEDGITWSMVARNGALGAAAFLALPHVEHGRGNSALQTLGAALVGLSVLLAWKLSEAIVRLLAYDDASGASGKGV